MSESKKMLIDLINELPNEAHCYIQAPSLEDEATLSLMQESEYDYFRLIYLNEYNKEKFIERIKEASVNAYIQHIEIRFNNKLLFEGYDGVEYGIFSKEYSLPQTFIEQYFNKGFYNVSVNW
jgi:hypothetical protein